MHNNAYLKHFLYFKAFSDIFVGKPHMVRLHQIVKRSYYFFFTFWFQRIKLDETTLLKKDWLLFHFTVWFQSYMVRRDHVVKEWLVIISFHGLVSIAYGTTRPRCERMTGYYFTSRSGFNRIWYDETTLWKNDWLLFYFTVWFQSHMVRRDHVVKERLFIYYLYFTVWFQSHMVRRDHVVKDRLFICFLNFTVWFQSHMVRRDHVVKERLFIYYLYFTVWFQSYMVRRDHVVKEWLVIILLHGLVSIAYGTTRPRCERMTGYYFISRSGFNRIWYDETTLWKKDFLYIIYISLSGFNRIWYDETTLWKTDYLYVF